MKGQKELAEYFRENNGILKFAQIIKSGFHADVLKALEKKGTVGRIQRGIYRLSTAVEIESDLVRVMIQSKKGVICLVSALSFYEVTGEIPRQVDIAVRRGMRPGKIEYPPVKYYRFSPVQWESGVEEYVIEGFKVRIYSLAKTVADCFKFRNRIGMDTARSALKAAIYEKKVKPLEILKYARICRVESAVKPVLEAVI